MSHAELQELIPAYALGALDAGECAMLEVHLPGCPDCRGRLAEYRTLSDDLAYAAPPVFASAHLIEDLRWRITASAPTPAPRFSLSARLHRPAFGLGLAAVAALAVLLVGGNVYWSVRAARAEREVAAVAALVQAPSVALAAADGDYGRGVLYHPPEGNVALLCVYGLEPLPAEKAYQVWLVTGQERVSAGTFRVTDDGYGILFIRPPGSLQQYDGVGITVEPAGGSPGPTTPRVLGGDL